MLIRMVYNMPKALTMMAILSASMKAAADHVVKNARSVAALSNL